MTLISSFFFIVHHYLSFLAYITSAIYNNNNNNGDIVITLKIQFKKRLKIGTEIVIHRETDARKGKQILRRNDTKLKIKCPNPDNKYGMNRSADANKSMENESF